MPDKNFLDEIALPLYLISNSFDWVSERMEEDFTITKQNHLGINESVYGLWLALRQTISDAQSNSESFFLLSFNSFKMSPDYSKKELINRIVSANKFGCDFLLGNIGEFNHAVPVDENLFWVDSFSYMSLIVIFSKAYSKILTTPPSLNEFDIYNYLSFITSHKLVLYPFIVFGDDPFYGIRRKGFLESGRKLITYQQVYRDYIKERVE